MLVVCARALLHERLDRCVPIVCACCCVSGWTAACPLRARALLHERLNRCLQGVRARCAFFFSGMAFVRHAQDPFPNCLQGVQHKDASLTQG